MQKKELFYFTSVHKLIHLEVTTFNMSKTSLNEEIHE